MTTTQGPGGRGTGDQGAAADVAIRRARPSDAATVTSLVEAAYTPYLARMSRRPAPMDCDYADAIASADVWVAERSDDEQDDADRETAGEVTDSVSDTVAGSDAGDGNREIVGVVVVRPAQDHLLIDNLAVHPNAQGCGVGAELLELVDEFACATGMNEIRLYTNVAMTENIAYYPRRGFVETHRATQDGFERVFFTKHINADGL